MRYIVICLCVGAFALGLSCNVRSRTVKPVDCCETLECPDKCDNNTCKCVDACKCPKCKCYPCPGKQKAVGHVTPTPKKLPREVQEQFDNYLMTSPVMEMVVVKVVKKVLEALLVTSLIALVTDYPFQVIGFYVLGVILISYPVTRFAISRELRSKVSG